MPDITGEKAIEVALQHRPGVHIIQCSGNDAPAAAASPCIHVFPKPYSPTIYRRRSNPGREGLEGRAAGNRLCNGAGQLGRASNLSPRAAALGRVLLLGCCGLWSPRKSLLSPQRPADAPQFEVWRSAGVKLHGIIDRFDKLSLWYVATAIPSSSSSPRYPPSCL